MVKFTKYAYIHVQRVEINQNRHFVFGFTSLPVLTVFSTVILTRSWWRRTLICNPKPSNPRRYPHTKFQENRTKTVAVTGRRGYLLPGMWGAGGVNVKTALVFSFLPPFFGLDMWNDMFNGYYIKRACLCVILSAIT